jgi:threonine/homoserine/homoserine lactone efflux protein
MDNILKGFLIGISIAAPVGPIGVLCIRRTLADGRLAGLATGLGAATADAVYGAIAAFGLAIITSFLVEQQIWLRLFGGLFLCYLGVRTFLAKPAEKAAEASEGGLIRAYLSTFVLTLTNPLTILSFAAIFAGISSSMESAIFTGGLSLVLGVFLGSVAWWLFLSGLVSLFRSRFDQLAMVWVNRISGAIILAFGVAALYTVTLNI